ncbi:MAG: type II toxin-antitoxin system RelE/ParE family toxin [bacterium]|nr:type II toxin-antitoxin system RelE/ParE family toxin [bacterium]
MEFEVEIAEPAEQDIEEAYLWFYEQDPNGADRWYRGLRRAIMSLRQLPRRCSIAPETRDLNREVRQLLYVRRRQMYRILYEIRGQTVFVLRLRHTARAYLDPGEIG